MKEITTLRVGQKVRMKANGLDEPTEHMIGEITAVGLRDEKQIVSAVFLDQGMSEVPADLFEAVREEKIMPTPR